MYDRDPDYYFWRSANTTSAQDLETPSSTCPQLSMSFGRPHLPRLETEYSNSPSQAFHYSLDATSPFTPVSSQVPDIPSFQLWLPTNDGTAQAAQDGVSGNSKPPVTNRARDEGRKLLAHVLTQLLNRPMPPSVAGAVGAFSEENKHSWNFKDAVKAQMGRLDRGQFEGEDSDDEDQDYSTDATFNLMIQLQEILVMSLEQQWDIFDDSGYDYPTEIAFWYRPLL